MRAIEVACALGLAVAACSPPPHAVLRVEDPDALTGGADALRIGWSTAAMERVSLAGTALPLTVTITAQKAGEKAVWVDAVDATGEVVARGTGLVRLRRKRTPAVVVVMGRPCAALENLGLSCAEVERGVCAGGQCIASVCGDGVLDLEREECEDGNLDDEDGCLRDCTENVCGDGVQNPSAEECDDGNMDEDDGCSATCRLEVCGDGTVHIGEECDDGDRLPNDGCSDTCSIEHCGDGVLQLGEACDDGNVLSADGCRADCLKIELCGDRVIDAGELCDDANDNRNDRCHGCQPVAWEAEVLFGLGPGARAAAAARLVGPTRLAAGRDGRIYIADGHRVMMWDPALDSVVPVAGSEEPGFSGDGGPALMARFSSIGQLAVDAFGYLYLHDQGNGRLRRISPTGMVETFAGGGSQTGPDVQARDLSTVAGVTIGPRGQLLTLGPLGTILQIHSDGSARHFAGGGTTFTEGMPAAIADLGTIIYFGYSGDELLLVCSHAGSPIAIRSVDLSGEVSTIVETAAWECPIVGGATDRIGVPDSVVRDAQGRLYFTVVKGFCPAAGIWVDDGGGSLSGFSTFTLYEKMGLLLRPDNSVLVAGRVARNVGRLVLDAPPADRFTFVAGSHDQLPADGTAGTSARFDAPRALGIDGEGRLLVGDASTARVFALETDGTTIHVAGSNSAILNLGCVTRNGPPYCDARAYPLVDMTAMTEDGTYLAAGRPLTRIHPDGTLEYVMDMGRTARALAHDGRDLYMLGNHRVYRVPTSPPYVPPQPVVSAGNGAWDEAQENGAASAALFDGPIDMVFAPPCTSTPAPGCGDLYVADRFNRRVRLVRTGGDGLDGTDPIVTVAGDGEVCGFFSVCGDGLSGTSAQIGDVDALALDAHGNLFIAHQNFGRLRRLSPGADGVVDGSADEVMSTIAYQRGDNLQTGDGGPAGEGGIRPTTELQFALDGSMYLLSDVLVRRIDAGADGIIGPDDTITTVVGGPDPEADGLLSIAHLGVPSALASLPGGSSWLIADGLTDRVRLVDLAAGRLSTVVGYPDGSDDGARYSQPIRDAAAASGKSAS